MASSEIEQISAAQKASAEVLMTLMRTSFEGMQRLAELNIAAARETFSSNVATVTKLASSRDVGDMARANQERKYAAGHRIKAAKNESLAGMDLEKLFSLLEVRILDEKKSAQLVYEGGVWHPERLRCLRLIAVGRGQRRGQPPPLDVVHDRVVRTRRFFFYSLDRRAPR